ncbi:uncharacterized protein E0L32_000831 [Thyridium curvatum]|uniref:Nephrocystin 3-like N-terminal domain-containing protein n=1 Tax=Thyridium curvatum TaxID=1093900 RepID=A0A507B1S1_9PEZI|nr:uncharacterized protein E0L32_000831 [Thyridium curvatum]TPX12654.1 hypothetical protein E0L32_000831 [Thyridium curvatum]
MCDAPRISSEDKLGSEQVEEGKRRGLNTFAAKCWHAAVEKSEWSIADDKYSPILFDATKFEANEAAQQAIEAGNLINRVEKETAKRGGKRAVRRAFGCVLDQLHRHSKTIDVLVQVSPTIGCGIWVPLRIILETYLDVQDCWKIAFDGIGIILHQVTLWHDLFPVFKDKEAETAPYFEQFYLAVFNFLKFIRKYLGIGSLKRTWYSFVKQQSTPLAAKLKEIQVAVEKLQDLIASENLQLAHATNMMVQELYGSIAAPFSTQALRSQDMKDTLEREVRPWLESCQRSHPSKTGLDRSPTPGTGQWLLEHEQFQRWSSLKGAGCLHIQGKPGAGKSFLASVIVDTLKQEQTTRHGVFLCRFPKSTLAGDLVFSAPHYLVTSLINQLLHPSYILGKPEYGRIIGELADLRLRYLELLDCPVRNLWQQKLAELCLVYNVKVLVLARSQAIFPQDLPTVQRFQIVITSELVAGDVKLYASCLFDSHRLPKAYKDATIAHFCREARENFLYVYCTIVYLSQPSSDGTYLQRLDARHCPPELHELYDQDIRPRVERMSSDERKRLQTVLVLLSVAAEPLTLEELSRITGSEGFDPQVNIVSLGAPLLSGESNKVAFTHHSTINYFMNSLQLFGFGKGHTALTMAGECHARLAEECLRCLLDEQYGSKEKIGRYLHRTLGALVDVMVLDTPKGVSLEYAAKYWAYHLTHVRAPTEELLELANSLLHTFQFAFWSEYSTARDGEMDQVIIARRNLLSWVKSLPGDKGSHISIDDYFESVYCQLSDAYREDSDMDKVLQWLAKMRLDMYYTRTGMTEKALPVRKAVAEGLTTALGAKHPLTLRAKRQLALAYSFRGWFRDANELYCEIIAIMKEVTGPSLEYFETLQAKGETELYMNNYQEAENTEHEAADGILQLDTPNANAYLAARLWYCYPLIEMGQLDKALGILKHIFDTRREKYGETDLFAASAQYSMGDIQRKLGDKDTSLQNLNEAYEVRLRQIPFTTIWVMDWAIARMIAFRDFGQPEEALDILRELDERGQVYRFFDRVCQVTHLRALLLHDKEQADEAIDLLQGLVISTDRALYKRGLMWILLDLAVMLRERGRPGDEKQAAANFDHIVKARGSDLDVSMLRSTRQIWDGGGHEPDPPRLLRLAEQALQLMRDRKFDQVDNLFREENIDWVRPEDLWHWTGGPAADTAWMKPPLQSYVIPYPLRYGVEY